jgi:hypothetical protein
MTTVSIFANTTRTLSMSNVLDPTADTDSHTNIMYCCRVNGAALQTDIV